MTERAKLEANETKQRIIAERGNKCEVCGKPVSYQTAQLAHVIEKSKANLKRYGAEVIHHPLNIKVVCGGRCNDAVLMSPKSHPVEAGELVEKIRRSIEDDKH